MALDVPNYQYPDGTARVAGDIGTVALAVRRDLPGPVVTDGQYGPLLSDSGGSLRVAIGGSGYAYRHGAGTFLLKTGSGRLARLVCNAVQALTLTVYDSFVGSGAKILVVTVPANGFQAFEVGVAFTAGLTLVMAGGGNFDVTAVFD